MTQSLTSYERRRQIEDLLMRIEEEFLETAGLRLTVAQAERRFGADAFTCAAILDALVDSGVLFKTRHRVYGRFFPHVVAA